jgi:small-conductance mechanosensitive channel
MVGSPARGGGALRGQRFTLGWVAGAFAALLLLPDASFAQDPGSAIPEARPPIPLPEVSGRAEDTVRFLREVGVVAARDPEVSAITEELPESRADVRNAAEITEEELLEDPGLDLLSDLQLGWEVRLDALEGWQATLVERAASLEQQGNQLEERLELWGRTRSSARSQGAPPPILERIDATTTSLRQTQDAVRERLAILLTLQDQVGQQLALAVRQLEAVEDARLALRGRIFDRDQPPLWRALGAEGEREPWWPAVRLSLQHDLDELQRFATARRNELLLAGLFFGVTALFALSGRRRARRWVEDDPRRLSFELFLRHPLASALLLTLIVTPSAFTRAPAIVTDVGLLAALFPALVILRELLPGELRGTTYALAGLYVADRLRDVVATLPLVADRLRDVVATLPLVERVVMASESIAVVVLVLWLARPARLAAFERASTIARLLRVATRMLLAGFVVSLGANLIGFVALARALVEGLLGSTYVAVVLYGVSRVLVMIVAILVRGSLARRLRVVRAHGRMLERRSRRAISWLATAAWAWVSLGLFEIRDTVVGGVSAWLAEPIELGAATISLGNAAAFLLALLVTVLFSRGLRFLLREEVYPRAGVQRGASHALSATIHYVILFLGFLLALSVAGVDLGRLTLLAGALGVGVGFGLQNIVNNFVSGLILLFERPVKVGDTVEVGALLGDVTRIGIRSSTVRTFDGAEVIVPNANLVSDQVINWTLSDRQRRVDVAVGVAYGTDPEVVLDLLRGVAAAHPEVLAEPAPVALFRGFGDSSLDFLLRVWVASFEHWFVVQSDLCVAVNAALARANIEIPFPQRDLHLRSVDTPAREALTDLRPPSSD